MNVGETKQSLFDKYPIGIGILLERNCMQRKNMQPIGGDYSVFEEWEQTVDRRDTGKIPLNLLFNNNLDLVSHFEQIGLAVEGHPLQNLR
jgi:hypothetical protein